MVCWTVEPVVNSATTAANARINKMEVQRAKKCKLWSEDDQQSRQEPKEKPPPPLPADPCPVLMPFFHQVSIWILSFSTFHYLFTAPYTINKVVVTQQETG